MHPKSSNPTPFNHGLRVYYEDTDAGGVVFYANYLKYFERARTEWLRNLGFSQELLRVQAGAMFVVSDSTLKYLSPARLDDWLRISVEVTELGRVSMNLFQQAWRNEQLLCEAQIRIACVDSTSFKPSRIPPSILDRISL